MPTLVTPTALTRVRSGIRPAVCAPLRYRVRVNMQEIELPPGTSVVGRSPQCRICIDDPMLSREHFEIVVEPSRTGEMGEGRVLLRDLKSRNGTTVNGARVLGEVELHGDDRVRAGGQELVLTRLTERAPMRTSMRLRRCNACAMPYAYDAESCPSCGDVAPPGDWLVRDGLISTPRPDSATGWVCELNLDCVDRALLLFRLDEAERSLLRAIDARGSVPGVDDPMLDRLHLTAIRVASASGEPKWITWALEDLHARTSVPPAAVVERFAALPPIVLEGAVPALEALVMTLQALELPFDKRVRVESLAALVKRVADWRGLHETKRAG